MATSSANNRYQNYGLYPSGDCSRTSVQCNSSSREASPRPNRAASCSPVNDEVDYEHEGHPGASSRLEYIVNAMAYIRGELVSLLAAGYNGNGCDFILNSECNFWF